MANYAVYALRRQDTGEVFYIGQTRNLKHRLTLHRHEAGRAQPRSAVSRLVRELIAQQVEITAVPLAKGLTRVEAAHEEAYWIQFYRAGGASLENQLDNHLVLATPAERERAKRATPEGLAAHRAAERRYKQTPRGKALATANVVLSYLRQGRPMTATREAHLRHAGGDYLERGLAIIAGKDTNDGEI